jgi:hypothetical protein
MRKAVLSTGLLVLLVLMQCSASIAAPVADDDAASGIMGRTIKVDVVANDVGNQITLDSPVVDVRYNGDDTNAPVPALADVTVVLDKDGNPTGEISYFLYFTDDTEVSIRNTCQVQLDP